MIFSLETEIILKNIESKILGKMTKAELSRQMEVTPQTLQVILKNLKIGKDCRISTIKKIAAAGGIAYEELLIKN